MEIEMRPDELYHYGRLGMKWGKHIFGRDKTGFKRRKGSRTDQGDGDAPKAKPKSHKDMTDDELRRETDRLNLEANYLNARSRSNPPTSQPQTKESFTKKFINDAVKPAIITAGKTQIEKYLNTEIEKLTKGKVDPDSIEYLKKKSEKQGFKTKIAENTQKMMEANRKIKQYQKEDKDAERSAREAEERRAAAQRQVDDYNNRGNTTYSKSGDNITDRRTPTGRPSSNRPLLEQTDRFEATGNDAEGEGTSRYTERDRGPARDIVYDGQRYVTQLLQLEDRHGR